MLQLARGKAQTKESAQITTWPLYIILIISFLLYILYQQVQTLAILFGTLTFIIILIIIILEVIISSKEQGKLKNAIEIVVAIIIVIGIWLGLRFILNTPYPIDAVPSCSMLPALQRGDMIILQGVKPSGIKANVVDVTGAEMQNMLNNIANESLECIAYKITGNTANISQQVRPGYSIGLFKESNNGGSIVPNSSQAGNLVKYQCGIANVTYSNGTKIKEAYTKAIIIGNTIISGDLNNSIIVYKTEPQDLFYKEGDTYVVHRAYAIINASGNYYYLTKGDNNPGLDIQYQNYPASQKDIEGKVIAAIPYIGYLKLILSGTLSQPAGCNYTFSS